MKWWCLVVLALSQRYEDVQAQSTRDVIWMDEGETVALPDSRANLTLCFYPKTSFYHINNAEDAVQLRRQEGQLSSFFQNLYTWPLNYLLWVFSDLKVYVSAQNVHTLDFYFESSPGLICRFLTYIMQPGPLLRMYAPNLVVQLIAGLNLIIGSYCEVCTVTDTECRVSCEPMSKESCIIYLSPFFRPCVTAASNSSLFSLESATDATVQFATEVSGTYVSYLLLGVFLTVNSKMLSRYRPFHIGLGATLGILLSVILGVYIIMKQTRSVAKVVPGADFAQSLVNAVAVVFPLTGMFFWKQLKALLLWTLSRLVDFWSADSVLGIPYLGKAYFVLFGTFGAWIVWWKGWGASPRQEPEEEFLGDDLDDEIEPRLTPTQERLSQFLHLLGLYFLYNSTSTTETSMLLVGLVFTWPVFEYTYLIIKYRWWGYQRPGVYTRLISDEEYSVQSQTATQKALLELREYLNDNPAEWERVKEENETRVRRFAHGRDHLQMDPPSWASKGKRRSFCIVS